MSSGVSPTRVKRNRPRPVSSEVFSGQCWVESVSSQFDLGPCRARSTIARVEWGRTRSVLRGVGPIPFQAKSVRFHVEQSRPDSMSSEVGPGPCRAESTWAHVEQIRPTPLSSLVDSGPYLAESGPARVERSQSEPVLNWFHIKPILSVSSRVGLDCVEQIQLGPCGVESTQTHFDSI